MLSFDGDRLRSSSDLDTERLESSSDRVGDAPADGHPAVLPTARLAILRVRCMSYRCQWRLVGAGGELRRSDCAALLVDRGRFTGGERGEEYDRRLSSDERERDRCELDEERRERDLHIF